MNRLKPCPFCGGNARLTVWTPTAASVSCIMCGAHFNTYTEAEAAEAWNTRAERMCRYVVDPDTSVELCSGCGAPAIEDWTADYCWSCGAKVVE